MRKFTLLAGLILGLPIKVFCLNGLDSLLVSKPNIIFILVDDMGWNGPSCYGNKYVKTPNIDKLCENGIKFTQAYTSTECTPSRAEILSGQFSARNGLTQVHTNRIYPNAPMSTPVPVDKLPLDNYTIANMLKDAGYNTAISGKWHVGNATILEKQKFYGFNYVGLAEEKPWDVIDKGKATTEQTSEITEFIRLNKQQPFFAFLSYYNIHTPLQAPDSLVNKYINSGYSKSTDRFGKANELPTAEYLAMINLLDNQIGRLTDSLRAMNLIDKTIIVFTSDNGALNRAWSNDPLRGAKGVLYEGGIRVPLIISNPLLKANTGNCDFPVHLVDLYPTFMELANGCLKKNKIIDGISLIPILRDRNYSNNRNSIVWHHPHYIHDYGKTPSSAIRKGDFKLIYYYGDYLDFAEDLPERNEPFGQLLVGEKIELFNINIDPGENNDLSATRPEIAEKMIHELNQWLNTVNAGMPKPSNNFKLDSWYKTAIHNQ